MRRSNVPAVFGFAFLSFLVGSSTAQAQYTWTGNSTFSQRWDDPFNWTGGELLSTPNDANHTATFASTTVANISLRDSSSQDQTYAVRSLTFESAAAAYNINHGTLSLTSGGSIAVETTTNTITINSAITMNGGLSLSNASTTSGQTLTLTGTLATGGNTLSVTGAGNIVISGSISGGGTISHTGTGKLSITSASGFSGTTTLASGSTLEIGNGMTNGSIGTGAITNNGTLTLNRSDAITFANDISGSGNLIQSGSGTTTLTGTNSYGGTTTISAGALVVGNGGTTGSLGSGAVTNDGALTFNRSDAIAVANNIGGSGSLTKEGAGTMTYTGTGTYLGTTTVNQGTMLIDGAGSLNGSGGTVIVLSGSTLGGTGTVARAIDVGNGAIVRGGSATTIGNLATTGDITINRGTITTRISPTTSGGSGTVADPFILNTNSKLALGTTGQLDFDTGTGKFKVVIENDSGLAPATTYRLVLATANLGNQYTVNGLNTWTNLTSTQLDVISGTVNTDLFNDVILTRSGSDLVLTFSTVPEPASLIAIGTLALGGAAFLRRRLVRPASVA